MTSQGDATVSTLPSTPGQHAMTKLLAYKLRTAEHPETLAYQDKEIIFSNGTRVLGADNKAAFTTAARTSRFCQ